MVRGYRGKYNGARRKKDRTIKNLKEERLEESRVKSTTKSTEKRRFLLSLFRLPVGLKLVPDIVGTNALKKPQVVVLHVALHFVLVATCATSVAYQ
jgi:hypothetical protein